ncbi:MAG: hypothetical protein JO307_30795 [Bryobacterales bacterium]|nr:hypothetical protein [Bryobacterales bacterium]MBV9398199.1 hypothetical protein [Bryobacterales bacterium]
MSTPNNGSAPATKRDLEQLREQLREELRETTKRDLEQFRESINREFEQFRELVIQLAGSLSRELHDFRNETREQVQRIEQVTRRHSTTIVSGSLSIGGLNKTAERIEELIHDRDKAIAELRDRVRALEEKTK